MEHSTSSPASPPAGIDPAAAPLHSASARSRRQRRCNADYRWTQPKVIAFLEALSQCGRVAEAVRAVGMSRTSAYRLRARMASARFDAAFEGARKRGIRARAATSRTRLAAAARSPWAGPGIAEMIARERAFGQRGGHGEQVDALPAQGAGPAAQGDGAPLQSAAPVTQGGGFPRKVPG